MDIRLVAEGARSYVRKPRRVGTRRRCGLARRATIVALVSERSHETCSGMFGNSTQRILFSAHMYSVHAGSCQARKKAGRLDKVFSAARYRIVAASIAGKLDMLILGKCARVAHNTVGRPPKAQIPRKAIITACLCKEGAYW